MKLIPKNWAMFQHYKDRAPPWIKLHRALLDDRQYQRLPLASRALSPMLWLLAAEAKDGVFDGAVEELAFRLRTTEDEIETGLKPLIDAGFFAVAAQDAIASLTPREQGAGIVIAPCEQVAGNVLATCERVATPETETETEAEAEAEAKKETTGSVGKSDMPACRTQAVVDAYHAALPELPSVKLMNDGRRKAISKFWAFALTSKKSDGARRATTAEEAIAWVRSYFDRARDNDFLMGRGPKAAGHEGWKCTLDFLLTEKGLRHVIEMTESKA